jgi:hypothetical protein
LEKGMMNQEWKIKARGHVCSVTGRPFADEEPFHTAIFEDAGTDGFVRRDFSVEAWEAERGRLDPFSHWRSVYEAPREEPRKGIVEKETAEGLLRRLIDADEPATENARFVLAVMLERKRTLRETDSRRLGEAMLRIYEHTKTGEVFIIRDPMLRLDQIDSIQAEVAGLLRQSEPANPIESGLPETMAPEEARSEPAPGGGTPAHG